MIYPQIAGGILGDAIDVMKLLQVNMYEFMQY